MKRHLSNRIYLIIIVVVSMTIGFITGYLVGIKHSAAPALSEQNKIEAKKLQGAQTEKGASSEMPSTVDIKLQNQEVPTNSIEQVKAEPSKSLENEKPKNEIKNIQHEKTSETDQKPAEEAVRQEHKSGIYTVQAGAFKNEKEAEALKTKLEKKGYNIYILKERKSKDGVLFKVRVGDFETKKEAEIFAIKLNKTVGLRSFAVKK
ncbi:MAG: SPOR domain-containing protein [Thermodesulfovibrionales bacterium]